MRNAAKALIGGAVILLAVGACFIDRPWARKFVLAVFFGCLLLALIPRAQAESGLASWYSGGGTACGDRVVAPMSAAHKSLPCGAVVRVTTRWGSAVVTIRDRGPFVRGRIIDVSRDVAPALGLLVPGVLPATVERLR